MAEWPEEWPGLTRHLLPGDIDHFPDTGERPHAQTGDGGSEVTMCGPSVALRATCCAEQTDMCDWRAQWVCGAPRAAQPYLTLKCVCPAVRGAAPHSPRGVLMTHQQARRGVSIPGPQRIGARLQRTADTFSVAPNSGPEKEARPQ
jgi:hypothetical protein